MTTAPGSVGSGSVGSGAQRPRSVVPLIEAKRDGAALTDVEVEWIVEAFTAGDIAPEQMSALAMAVYFQGMSSTEVSALTRAMVASGERLDLSGLRRRDLPDSPVVPTVDKHSTGGVGDAITLVLTPLLATYPVAVPQLSGRGLGHTGGTLDKLESVPGWRAELSGTEFRSILEASGAVVCAAGAELAPADKALYALRDVTGTVPSIPLIASSIMSKKIAEGTGALVLDVKCGSGAFMRDVDSARELARTMVDVGTAHGVRCAALVTDMSTPLGRAVGNALEVAECLEVLGGTGPADMRDLTIDLARAALALVDIDPDAPGNDPAARLDSGRAMEAWRAMVGAQGGDPDAPLPRAPLTDRVYAPAGGFVRWDALGVGRAAWTAGAGRSVPGQAVDHGAGVELDRATGEEVEAGDAVATVHASDRAALAEAVENLYDALVLTGGTRSAVAAGTVLERW